jgi:hypothetical protein
MSHIDLKFVGFIYLFIYWEKYTINTFIWKICLRVCQRQSRKSGNKRLGIQILAVISGRLCVVLREIYSMCNKSRSSGNGSRHGFPVLCSHGLHVFTHIWAKLCSVWIQTVLQLIQLTPRFVLSLPFAFSILLFHIRKTALKTSVFRRLLSHKSNLKSG